MTPSSKTVDASKAAALRAFHVLPNDTPICGLECERAWAGLTDRERLYAYHLSRAAWLGSFVIQLQTSTESASIGALLYAVFAAETTAELKAVALESGMTADAWQSLLIYFVGFWHNNGNYKGFGDSKFVPALADEAAFVAFVKATKAYAKAPKEVQTLLDDCSAHVLTLDGCTHLGFSDTGVTTYVSRGVTKEDSQAAVVYMGTLSKPTVEPWNTRLVRRADGVMEIRLAGVERKDVHAVAEHKGVSYVVTSGDYSPLMARIIPELRAALAYTANEQQTRMIEHYIAHYTTGHIDEHKNGSREWITDRGPAVESYMGFIENYRDPAGVRAEFEGFVAAVDKVTSERFQHLVESAPDLLPHLPWHPSYEKDTFLKPDFTSLDVLAFAASGPPAGINIPNYDDIRQAVGFKNVSLGNIISAIPDRKITMLGDEDERLQKEHYKHAFEVQVGLHELLGHGSGKLFMKLADDTYNFDPATQLDMLTDKPVTSYYQPGESWSSVFGALANPMEECRAEAVGYLLCLYPSAMKVFKWEGEAADTVVYVNWLSNMRAGLVGMEMYDPSKHKWGQAHSYARFVLLQVMLREGGGVVAVTSMTNAVDGKPDVRITVDRSKLHSHAKPALETFLRKLQNYKSTANYVDGAAMFEGYGKVDDKWLAIRDIVIARRSPRRLNLQPNMLLNEQGTPTLREYPHTEDGYVRSIIDRFVNDAAQMADAVLLARNDKHYFKQ